MVGKRVLKAFYLWPVRDPQRGVKRDQGGEGIVGTTEPPTGAR